MIKEMCRNFTETELKPVAAINDRNHTYPAEQVRKLGELGMMGVSVSMDYGGSGEMIQAAVNARIFITLYAVISSLVSRDISAVETN